MSDQDLFTEINTPDPELDESKDYLAELVGENKPYKDPQALAKAVIFKQKHIERLEQEHQGMRQDLQGRDKLQDLVEKLAAARENSQGDGNQSTTPKVDGTPALKPEDLDKLIEQKLNAVQQEAKRNDNFREVKKVLEQRLGSNYPAKLRQQAQALSMTPEALNSIAAENPQAFYRLVGLDTNQKQDNLFTPPETKVNSFGVTQTDPDKVTETYFDNLRKTKPSQYWSVAVQNQLHQFRGEQMKKQGLI
jgi:hypothetical protein